MMDCQKNSLEHYLKIGLFGWMDLAFYNTNTVLSDEQQKRTLGTVTNQNLIFGVFFFCVCVSNILLVKLKLSVNIYKCR